jgi:NADPH:quinone reductase-like Zn-dependent oxidoreductase
MRAYEIAAGSTSFDGLRSCERPDPTPLATQILVRMRAASLNYRDLAIAKGRYLGGPLSAATIALSDGAGEVIAVGAAVTRFKVGQRVAGTFFRGWNDGAVPSRPVALGAPPADGVLAELAVFDQDDAVLLPEHLSWSEAATLSCAAVTAWHALIDVGQLSLGKTVLLLGTGGVSVFALQFAHLAGARVVITSSSDSKLERARTLGAAVGINYRRTPEWDREVLAATEGRGVDVVVEVGGSGTLGRSMASVASGGRIVLIGVLTGLAEAASPYALMGKQASMHGIFVGSRAHFEHMNRAIAMHRLQPVVDREFSFADAPAAYQYLDSAQHFGKVVIRL